MLYRLTQRLWKPRTDVAENALLDKLVDGGGKLLKRMSRISRILMLILFLASMGLVMLNVVSITGDETLQVELSDTWSARWTALSERLAPGQFRKTLFVATVEKRYAGIRDGIAGRLDQGLSRLDSAGDGLQPRFTSWSTIAEQRWTGISGTAAGRWAQIPLRADQSVQNMLRAFRSMLSRLQSTSTIFP